MIKCSISTLDPAPGIVCLNASISIYQMKSTNSGAAMEFAFNCGLGHSWSISKVIHFPNIDKRVLQNYQQVFDFIRRPSSLRFRRPSEAQRSPDASGKYFPVFQSPL